MIRISARMPPILSAPPVSPPRTLASGTSTSSSRISPVTDARTAILSIGLPSVTPRMVRRSTRKSAMFFSPRSPDVFAATVNTSATGALVTHVFVPRSTQRSPRRSARVARLATSEPAFGSVIANVAIGVDEVRAHERLHARGGGHRQRAARQLLGEETVGRHVGVGAAVLFGIAEAQPTQLADASKQRDRELAALIHHLRGWYHFGGHEARHALAELLLLGRERDH